MHTIHTIHRYHYTNTNPIEDSFMVDINKALLASRVQTGKAIVGLPPWKLKRRIRRAEARIEAAYQNALMIGAMHSDNYNEGVIL